MKIKTGDKVIVIAGADKGKVGTVQKAFFVISPKCMKRQKKMIANITETAHSTSNQSFRWNAFTAKMPCGTSHNDNPTLSHIQLK
jgi:hypothetical protein